MASSRSDATSSPPEISTQPDFSQKRSDRNQCVVKPHVSSPGDLHLLRHQPFGEAAHQARRHRLVYEVESTFSCLVLKPLNSLDREIDGGRLVARDIVEGRIAEGALLPVTTVRECQLVKAPTPTRLECIDRGSIEKVLIKRQTTIGRRSSFRERNIRFIWRRGIVNLTANTMEGTGPADQRAGSPQNAPTGTAAAALHRRA